MTRPGSGGRHGDRGEIGAYVGVFLLLFCFAGYTIIDSSYLTSSRCIGPDGQLPLCPSKGPDWARPLPAGAAAMGMLIGLSGLLIGRPVRTPAMVLGFVLTLTGMVAGWLMWKPS